MIKKWDVLLILVLLALSCIPLAVFHQTVHTGSVYADISIDGSLYKRVPLTAHRGHEEIEINNQYGHNTIIIEDETICITESDCPDQLCVHMGKAAKPGENIVCLPHKLIIEIKSSDMESSMPDIIPAH